MSCCVKLRRGNDIVLTADDLGLHYAIDKLKRKYTVPNPEFYRRERMGKWTGSTPQEFALWENRSDGLHFPYGALSDIIHALRSSGCGISFEKDPMWYFPPIVCAADFDKIKLYDYQQKAFDAAMKAYHGVLVAPCGSGKTQIGLEIAAQLGYRTLWLTHTHDLLNQSMSRAKACFDLPDNAFGTITGGKINIGNFITFATVQTMVNLDLSHYKHEWNCIIVDECHHVAGSPTKVMQFSKVVGSLSAKHKFGLTATPKRQDGLTACMFAYLGPKFHEISKEAVGDKTCPVEYQFVDTGWDCDVDDVTNPDGTLDYTKLINVVCEDKDRNDKICYQIHIAFGATRDGVVLVLSERVGHLERLREDALGSFVGRIITGKTPKAQRDLYLQQVRDGNCHLIFATYQLAKEGLDIPNLSHVILASPNKTDTTITQAVGRVSRACKGKDHGTVIDFNDEFMPLMRWADKRRRIYKRLGMTEKNMQKI